MANLTYTMLAPHIIKETSSGFFFPEIKDEMFLRRDIQCIGEINEESVNSMITQILYLDSISDEEIRIFINSPGGEVSSGLALYDVMQGCRSKIHTVCVGTAASMGSVLFVAGDRRDILPHGRIMIHDPLIGGGIGGSALHIQTISDGLMKTREEVASILAKHTGKSIEEIYEKTRQDSYFYAEEAVEFGLADRIVEKLVDL